MSMNLANGNFDTPPMTFATMPVIPVNPWSMNSLVTYGVHEKFACCWRELTKEISIILPSPLALCLMS